MAGIWHPQFYCCLNERGSLETCLVTEGVCGVCHVMFSLNGGHSSPKKILAKGGQKHAHPLRGCVGFAEYVYPSACRVQG